MKTAASTARARSRRNSISIRISGSSNATSRATRSCRAVSGSTQCGRLVGFHLCWQGLQGRGRALGVGKVKFFGQVLPTAKKVTYQIDIKRVIARKLNMAIADGSLSVDGREIYTAEDLRVGLFTSTDDF